MKHLALLILLAGCDKPPTNDCKVNEKEFRKIPCVMVFSEGATLINGCGFDETVPTNVVSILEESNRKMKGWK